MTNYLEFIFGYRLIYQKSYEHYEKESSDNFTRIEREALLRAINELEIGLKESQKSIKTIKACALIQSIWTIFLTDVMSDGNKLPVDLRAKIISIGLWIQRELSDIETGKSNNFSGVIEVNKIIAEGLK